MAHDGTTGLDTSDIDRWIGVPLPRLQLRYPTTEADIGRWVQSMHNPNPRFYDPDFFGESENGLVAPQSFTVAAGDGHGATPAIQGAVEGTHMLFGGDEWWFYGPRIRAGDLLQRDGMLFDYKVADTKFAGPTIFSRGDTTYANQKGEFVAKQRCTAIRYVAEEARKRATYADDQGEPTWTAEQLAAIDARQLAYYETFRAMGHEPRRWKDVAAGDTLPDRPLGPHSVATFATEHRARPATVWGAAYYTEGRTGMFDAGWLSDFARDREREAIDPAKADGLYAGASRGHADVDHARDIGMPRGYGYGSSMGGWLLDYIENWGGEGAWTVHMNASYRSPALTGDVTELAGEVVGTRHEPETRRNLVDLELRMSDQNGRTMATATAEVCLPG